MVDVVEVLSEITRHLKARKHHFVLMGKLNNGKHIIESTSFDMPMAIEQFAIFLCTSSVVGSGCVQEKQHVYLVDTIQKVNVLFERDLSNGDQLVYVYCVLKGKFLENEALREGAAGSSKEQFTRSQRCFFECHHGYSRGVPDP